MGVVGLLRQRARHEGLRLRELFARPREPAHPGFDRGDHNFSERRAHVGGIDRERPVEAVARVRQRVRTDPAIDPVRAAKPEIERVRIGGGFGPPRFDANDLGAEQSPLR